MRRGIVPVEDRFASNYFQIGGGEGRKRKTPVNNACGICMCGHFFFFFRFKSGF
jgi:hypothetical protein